MEIIYTGNWICGILCCHMNGQDEMKRVSSATIKNILILEHGILEH